MKLNCKKFEEKIIDAVESIIEDILVHEGMELIDITYRREPTGWVLRVLIDQDGGITVDDCKNISRQLSDILDVKDIIQYAYKLEVSSPGINRPLKKEMDFKRFRGENIRLKTYEYINNRKNFLGRLTDYKDGSILLDIDGKNFIIPHTMVVKANVEHVFKKKARIT